MKTIAILFLILAFWQFGFAQDGPLTQPEYVKLLYALQKAPATRDELVTAIRKRGIGFVLTDGLRGLTRSKAGADDGLQRALEEADRRRRDPSSYQAPSVANAAKILDQARTNTLEAVEAMPDFVVKQLIQRSWAFAGTNNFKNLDRLVVAVSYRSSGEENYRVLSTNGIVNNDPELKTSYAETGGTSSTGEFVTMLSTVFKPASETKFELIDADVIGGRRAIVFDYAVEMSKAQQMITSAGRISSLSTPSGMKGRIWIDRQDARVLKIESEATDIPESFPVRSARRTIDYEWVTIADEKFLLPSISDVRLTSRESGKMIETRNVIRFRDYQKYGTDVVIREDDDTPVETDEKP